jgi:mRNA interferase HigB
MRLISRRKLREHWETPGREDSKQALLSWYKIAKSADWSGPDAIKLQYRNASFVSGNRVVFNIAGNKYRLVIWFNYSARVGLIRFVGTHAEYDKIDAGSI